MSSPICHRTIGPFVALYGLQHEGKRFDFAPESVCCIGSFCALWVPEGKSGTGSHPAHQPDGRSLAPTGRGWCAENRLREPWPDPAAVKTGGAS